MGAARLMLDEDYGRPEEQHPSDDNTYYLGKIGHHNVVIACLGFGSSGIVSAATVASKMLLSFESVRVSLLVGIGGGIPSEQHDIRLGDIIVSKPGDTTGGIIQYELEHELEHIEKNSKLKRIGSLNRPPALLLKAIASLQSDIAIGKSKIAKYLSEGVAKMEDEDERACYSHQGISNDKLFQADYQHEGKNASCSSCAVDKLVDRSYQRRTTKPYIHYGIIASGNQVVRSSLVRRHLEKELGAICVEMEAAGLMNEFPCLVIRGISDYADSHKNDIWQCYAAATAAAYAKALLEIIPRRQIIEEKTVAEQIKALDEKVTNIVDSNRKIYNMNEKVAQKFDLSRLRPVEGAAFNSYQLNSAEDSQCHPDTRVDLIQEIKAWFQDPEGKTIFWLSGMAGTGKSTVSRTIAQLFARDHHLGASFFFKRGEGDRSHAGKLFTTLASQLVGIVPALVPYVTEAIGQDPSIPAQSLKTQFERLIFQPLSEIAPTIGTKLAIVIDALDECESERDINVTIHLLSKFRCIDGIGLKVFLTSRPELPIRLGFKELSEGTYRDLILHEIPRPIIEHDISAFLRYELAKIRRDYNQRLPGDYRLPDNWPGEPTTKILVDIASPLFIFAATMCRFIGDSRWDPEKQLVRVLEYQTTSQASKFDKTYLPILDQLLDNMNNTEKEYILEEFRTIVGSIVILANPLSINALASLLEASPKAVAHRLDLLHSALSVPDDQNTPVRLLHLSFRDFLLDTEKQGKSPFWIDEKEGHKFLLAQCLKRLSRSDGLRENICNLPSPGFERLNIDHDDIQKNLPADVQYACRYWVYHLEKSQSQISDHECDPVYIFLQEHFLHWLEALSLLGDASQIIHYITTIGASVARECTKARQFTHDAKRFISRNQRCIDSAPLQIYSSGLIFAPETCVIKNTFKARIPGWIHGLPAVEKHWGSVLQTLEGHNSSMINILSFSPDSRLLVSGGNKKTAMLWDVSTGTLLQTFEDCHSNRIWTVVFSPDGQQILTGSSDGTAILWDSNTGEKLYTLQGHRGKISAVIFSPDGKLLFTADSRDIKIWNSDDGSLNRTLTGGWAFAQSIVFSSDATLFASIPDTMIMRIWDSALGTPLRTISIGNDFEATSRVALSHDGRILAVAKRIEVTKPGTLFYALTSSVSLWDLATGVILGEPRGNWGVIVDMVFSSAGLLFAVAKNSGSDALAIWDINTGEQLLELEKMTDKKISITKISPDGEIIAFLSQNNSIEIRDTLSTESPLHVSSQCPEPVGGMSFSPDSKLIASISRGGTIRIWDPNKEMRKIHEIKQSDPSTKMIVVFSPDSKLVATARLNRIQLWDLETETFWAEVSGPWGDIYHILFLPNGKLLNFAQDQRQTMVWKVEKGELDQEIFTEGTVNCIAISPDNKQVALSFGVTNASIGVWNLATKSYCWMLRQEGSSRDIGFSSDSKSLLFVNIKGWFVCDSVSGSTLQSFGSSAFAPVTTALSPNSNFLASVYSNDYVGIRIWDLTVKQTSGSLGDQVDAVEKVLFSPNGKIAASILVKESSQIQIWDLKTGATLRYFDGIYYGSPGLVFSADGRKVAIRTSDRTIDIWRLDDESAMLKLESNFALPDDNPGCFSPDGTLIATKSRSTNALGNEIILWDIATGVARFKIPVSNHTSYIFSPDSIFLAVMGRSIRLWDSNTGILRTTVPTDSSDHLVFSSDGRFMISSVTPAEVSTRKFPFDTPWKTISLTSIPDKKYGFRTAISPDGQLIALYTRNKIFFLDIATGSIMREILEDLLVYKYISFSETGPYLLVDNGYLNIAKFYNPQPVPTLKPQHAFHLRENWITRDGERILWLPQEHRPYRFAFHHNTFMIGTESGLVYFLRF
ncbi:hypothetical protein TWF730_006965 [Orbilia blumenaviensis]|uniref:NACHT domain-containing protein n=1 Tax=Orbilia blumenaviensis TaxID=1796055 RepID=A0AAV9VG70_9PEZI